MWERRHLHVSVGRHGWRGVEGRRRNIFVKCSCTTGSLLRWSSNNWFNFDAGIGLESLPIEWIQVLFFEVVFSQGLHGNHTSWPEVVKAHGVCLEVFLHGDLGAILVGEAEVFESPFDTSPIESIRKVWILGVLGVKPQGCFLDRFKVFTSASNLEDTTVDTKFDMGPDFLHGYTKSSTENKALIGYPLWYSPWYHLVEYD
jgi:hypothetical protein